MSVKTNRHAPQEELRFVPKFFAFRYYFATIDRLPDRLLKPVSFIPQGSIDRRLRWLYSEELVSADDRKVMEANVDVIKTLSHAFTTLLTNVPEASPGARLLD